MSTPLTIVPFCTPLLLRNGKSNSARETTASNFREYSNEQLLISSRAIVGPVNGEIAVLSSGAGYISYVSLTPPLKVYVPTSTNPFPSCTETTAGRCETANTFYGFLPSNSNLTFKQFFEVNKAKAMIIRRGTPRPSTRFFGK